LKECRRAIRIDVSLEGHYWKLGSTNISRKIEKATIFNVSVDGCGFNIPIPDALLLYNRIMLNFKLDNVERQKIQREASLCRVVGNFIGCKFVTKRSGYPRT
jgi:hypothetical protein